MDYGFDYTRYQPFDQQIFPPSITLFENKKVFDFMFYWTKEVPVKALDKVSRLPGIIDTPLRKQARMMNFILSKVKEIYGLFDHFTVHEWIFQNQKTFEYIKHLTNEEREDFIMDTKLIDWSNGIGFYGYGVQRYMMK
jgi:hypothetical protein